MFTRVSTEIIDWLALPVLLVIIVLLVRRKTGREFPHFLFYLLVVESVGIVRLLVFQFARKAYFYTFWISDVLMAIFTFLVAYELFVRRLFPRFFETTLYRYLFSVGGFVVAVTAVPAALANRKVSLLLSLMHGLQIIGVAVLFFFIALMLFMGRRWKRYEFGIAVGLGVQVSAGLITTANWSKDLFSKHLTDRLPLVAFDLACLIWLITFLKPEKPTPAPTTPISPEVLAEARKWQEAAKGSLTKKKDSE